MIITHNIPWDKCLSKQLFPAIEKGWSNEGRPTHFFWGLAGKNIRGIKECIEKNEEWWYVDVGYLTQQMELVKMNGLNRLQKRLNNIQICLLSLEINLDLVINGGKQI